MNRSKRELERLSASPGPKALLGIFERCVLRDQIALLEVDIVALEMLVLRVLSAEKSGKNRSTSRACSLKIKGSEIQQRHAELMMLAAGLCHALHRRGHGSGLAGPEQFPGGGVGQRATGIHLLTCARPPSTVAPTKCSATSWLRPSFCRSQVPGDKNMDFDFLTTRNNCATPYASGWTRATRSSAAAPRWQAVLTAHLERTGRTGPHGPSPCQAHMVAWAKARSTQWWWLKNWAAASCWNPSRSR